MYGCQVAKDSSVDGCCRQYCRQHEGCCLAPDHSHPFSLLAAKSKKIDPGDYFPNSLNSWALGYSFGSASEMHSPGSGRLKGGGSHRPSGHNGGS